MVAGLEFAGAFLASGPLAARKVKLRLEGLAALAFLVQLGSKPVALRPEGAEALVALDQGDGLLGGLMFIFPKALLSDPEAAIGGSGGSRRTLASENLLRFLGGFERHGTGGGNGLGGVAVGATERHPDSTLVSNQRLLTAEAPKMHVPHVEGLKQGFRILTSAKKME